MRHFRDLQLDASHPRAELACTGVTRSKRADTGQRQAGNSESKKGGSFEPPTSLVVVLDDYFSPGIYSNTTNADFSPVLNTDTCW
jgi:hypothetical protein